jgi:hypothetical protein
MARPCIIVKVSRKSNRKQSDPFFVGMHRSVSREASFDRKFGVMFKFNLK